jgi:hypothetical protein
MPDIYNCERAATTPLGGFFPAIGSMFGRKKAHSLRPWQKERLSFQHPRPARRKGEAELKAEYSESGYRRRIGGLAA